MAGGDKATGVTVATELRNGRIERVEVEISDTGGERIERE